MKDFAGGHLTLPDPGQNDDGFEVQSKVSDIDIRSIGSDSVDLANIETPPTTHRIDNGISDSHRTFDVSPSARRTLDRLEAEFVRRSQERAYAPDNDTLPMSSRLTGRQSPLRGAVDSRRAQSPVFVNHDNPDIPIDINSTVGRQSPIHDRANAGSPFGRRSPVHDRRGAHSPIHDSVNRGSPFGRRSPVRADLDDYFSGSSRNPFIEDIDDNGYPIRYRYEDDSDNETQVDNFFHQRTNSRHRQAVG